MSRGRPRWMASDRPPSGKATGDPWMSVVERGAPWCSDSESRRMSFIARHDLWNADQRRAAEEVMPPHRSRSHRSSCAFRFPTCTASCAARRCLPRRMPGAMRDGCAITSTLLLKDTSHRTVVPVFSRGRRARAARSCRAAATSSWCRIPRPSACCRGCSRRAGCCAICIFADGTPVPIRHAPPVPAHAREIAARRSRS